MEPLMNDSKQTNLIPAQLSCEQLPPDILSVSLSGSWVLDQPLPEVLEIEQALTSSMVCKTLIFGTSALHEWDSGLLIFLVKVRNLAEAEKINLDLDGLPDGARRLLLLTTAVPKREGAEKTKVHESFTEKMGGFFLESVKTCKDLFYFIGDATVAFAKFILGRATFRFSDLFLTIQECGAEALPVVTLISVLIGLILAFVGAVQLALFGAQIYVADLVAIAMLREMGAMMTGIIMAGRTGAAFAAQLGTMQVNEEIDALKTLGLQPMEFLVLPRMLALILMMPLLCVYADLLGILGGAVVGVGVFDITLVQYFEQTRGMMHLSHFLLGVFKSVIFGIIIALVGCQRGMECGRSAMAVGYAATSAVVTSIVIIIALDGFFAVITNILGI